MIRYPSDRGKVQRATAMLEAGEIFKEDYDKWRYHYPKFDDEQKRIKVMSRTIRDLIVDTLQKGGNK